MYVISAPMSPIFGLLVDKTGKNIIWVLCAVATTLVSHMMLAFTFWNPWIAMVISGGMVRASESAQGCLVCLANPVGSAEGGCDFIILIK